MYGAKLLSSLFSKPLLSIVLIERPLQGCTVVATEQVASPSGAETGDGEDGEVTGTDEAGNIATGGEATSPIPPGSPGAELGPDDWQCPICFGNHPQQARVRPQCCGSLINIEFTRQIVGRELAAIREQIRLPFSCPMCRRRSAFQRDADGASVQLVVGVLLYGDPRSSSMSLLTVSLFAVLLTFPYAMQLVFNTRRSTARSSTTQPCPKTCAGWPSEPRGMQPQPVLQCATWTRSTPCSQMLVDFSSAGAGRHIRPSCSGMQLWTQRAMQAQPSRWLCVQPPRRLEGRKHRTFGSASTWSDQSFYRGTKGKLRPVGPG